MHAFVFTLMLLYLWMFVDYVMGFSRCMPLCLRLLRLVYILYVTFLPFSFPSITLSIISRRLMYYFVHKDYALVMAPFEHYAFVLAPSLSVVLSAFFVPWC
jgi:hypothetical protein